MRVIRDDFESGQPSSAVGSDWFNAVARFINKLTGSNGIRVNREGEFPSIMIDPSVSAMGTVVDNSSASVECPSGDTPEPSTLTFTNWTAGGENGVKIRLYALVDGSTNGEHILFPVDITIAANGIIKSVAAPTGDHGVYIGA